jgi:hypothetical protein
MDVFVVVEVVDDNTMEPGHVSVHASVGSAALQCMKIGETSGLPAEIQVRLAASNIIDALLGSRRYYAIPSGPPWVSIHRLTLVQNTEQETLRDLLLLLGGGAT